MDYERINPCAAPLFVRIVGWAETGCWCCTSVRSLLVGVCAGIVVGLAVAGKLAAALITGAIMAPLVITVLAVARSIWQESYAKDAEEAPK